MVNEHPAFSNSCPFATFTRPFKMPEAKKMKIKTTVCLVFFLGAVNIAFLQNTSAGVEKVGETAEVENKNINWEYFDSTSKISINEIKFDNIQGVWKAYKGLFKFGDVINTMNLTQPFILEIKDEKYRRSLDSKFRKFTIESNNFISKKKDVDFGIINKITEKELIITWKNGSNYTRYYYSHN